MPATEKSAKEHPILFSGPMVRAILDGRKTQTRRVISWPKDCDEIYVEEGRDNAVAFGGGSFPSISDGLLQIEDAPRYRYCRYGVVGDRLWVKESFYAFGRFVETGKKTKNGRPQLKFVEEESPTKANGIEYVYVADAPEYPLTTPMYPTMSGWHKRPSIFMRRKASRITLEITNVRVERLQDLTEEDAKAEGFDRPTCANFFQQAAGKIRWSSDSFWLEHEETGDEFGGDNGYMCLPCAQAELKKYGKKWFLRRENCPETDGPAYCSCGTPLLMSLTQYGIERELFLETFGDDENTRTDVANWPASGMDAKIAEMIADGYGDLQDKHLGRLAQIGFSTAWNLINGKKHPWSSNPWVWVIDFVKV